ncbi:MAG: type IV pilus modification protein PilV [Gammaproteobacteria bacterium]|nr:type IV pilus modification protein PilV [Gammaproteobacteria bacterium]MDH5799601.1 type IV pilus modification protein PilV [Gammaproteobacteria bacterium]
MGFRPTSNMAQAKGATMVEVLVSLLILSLGLLGVAGLQTTGLRSNQSAYLRSQATHIASDMADRMRANLPAVDAGNYDNVNSNSVPADPGCIKSATGCTSTQLAQHDIREWSLTSKNALPLFVGTVSKDGMSTAEASDDVYVITVRWNDVADKNLPTKSLIIRVRM